MSDMGATNRPASDLAEPVAPGHVVLGVYDLTCLFCDVAQNNGSPLILLGGEVVELPFQAHPEVPAAGLHVDEQNRPWKEQP